MCAHDELLVQALVNSKTALDNSNTILVCVCMADNNCTFKVQAVVNSKNKKEDNNVCTWVMNDFRLKA